MKRLLSMCLALLLLVSTFGCDKNTHVHSYEKNWVYNASKHWQQCSCGNRINEEIHVLDNYTCSICGFVSRIEGSSSEQTKDPAEINDQAIKYVGEITTYDKQGKALSLGTGFVYSHDGRIITNYHVIDDAYSAAIVINGKTHHIQYVLAYDENIDLAVLKIDGAGFEYAKISEKEISVGSTVYAIGSSRGLTNTFSQGIVTYYNRVVDGVSHIQHDASITNGNSGGPLINEYGEVVGINTWGVADSQNLNFAVCVKELDNLEFGKKMTVSELYENRADPHEVLKDWLIQNYTSSQDGDACCDLFENEFLYRLVYDSENDYVALIVHSGTSMILIDISCPPTQMYYIFTYETNTPVDSYKVTGYLNANVFTRNTKLTNYNYTAGSYLKEEQIVDLASTSIAVAIEYLRSILLTNSSIGLSIRDLGFLNYA